MKWYINSGVDSDVVVSSRIRLARNLDELPFPNSMDRESSEKVIDAVRSALEKYGNESFHYLDMEKVSRLETSVLLEDHLVSREFCEQSGTHKMLITDETSNLAVMLNEEDHIRIQTIYAGFAINEAYERANAIDDCITKGVNLAFDETLGYLTSCPTNLGTGLRASVMLHLPAISASGYIKSLISLMTKIGLTVRGLYGEYSEAKGQLYQLSNQVTLGICEKDTLEKLTSAVLQIAAKERELRKTLSLEENISFQDKLWRSYGVLVSARKMTADEAAELISNVRLGAQSGIIPALAEKNLIKLLIEIMPAHMIERNNEASDSDIRDKLRADYIREKMR